MNGDSNPEDLKALAERIARAEKAAQPVQTTEYVATHRRAIKLVRVGSDFVALIVLAVFAGLYVDRWLGTAPWIMLGLLAVAFGAGFWMMVRFIGQQERKGPQGFDGSEKE